MRLSDRFLQPKSESPVYKLLQQKQKMGEQVYDLTCSNPTLAGIEYPVEKIRDIFFNADMFPYQPDPRGLPSCRKAIAYCCRRFGRNVDANQIFVTSGTSEAYSLLFKILCNPGDEVLYQLPGYPLIPELAEAESLTPIPYRLNYQNQNWVPDINKLARCISTKTKAIVIVNPNNPTGSIFSAESTQALAEVAREHDLSIIIDEVFIDYLLQPKTSLEPGVFEGCKVFRLNGLSKILGLPQFKVSWIELDEMARDKIIEDALETLGDLYLSVNTWTQAAVPGLLQLVEMIQSRIHDRIQTNIEDGLKTFAEKSLWQPLKPQGGWSLPLRPVKTDSINSYQILKNHGLYLHDGDLFDFPEKGWLVASLLTRPDTFQAGIKKLIQMHF